MAWWGSNLLIVDSDEANRGLDLGDPYKIVANGWAAELEIEKSIPGVYIQKEPLSWRWVDQRKLYYF